MDVSGVVQTKFEPVREAFAAVLAAQQGAGAAVAVWFDGRWVVDLWGGRQAGAGSRGWQPDSLVQVYSVTKPFAVAGALLLVERGLLHLDAAMQRYWPQFQAPATVAQVLSHQAGVVVLDAPAPTELFYDWHRLCALLAGQAPVWKPGTRHGESLLFYGHLVGELVRRVDGRTLGRFLRDEICGPLGLDFAVGLGPCQQVRVVDLIGLDEQFRLRSSAGRPELYRRAVANPPGAQDPAIVNSAPWRAAEVPAINGHGSARGVAGLYAGLLQGRIVSLTLLREVTRVHCAGPDAVLGEHTAWGLGFGIDADWFGMGGLGGSIGGACPTGGGYAFGFVTASMGDHQRATQIENALRSCLGLPPLPD
ncbi:MAG: beta-lactamase family protein [Pseudonocardiales bacterium]|nr:beta-lactamase family protein [Pseudonocardiales bacterium]